MGCCGRSLTYKVCWCTLDLLPPLPLLTHSIKLYLSLVLGLCMHMSSCLFILLVQKHLRLQEVEEACCCLAE
jgi:hypothetical protein